MSDSSSAIPPASGTTPNLRTIRTFKHAEDAEAAQRMLKEHGIEASLLELTLPPGSVGRRTAAGAMRMVVETEVASRAEQLLKKEAEKTPTKAQEAIEAQRERRERSHARWERDRRSLSSRRLTGAPFIILLALLGSLGGVVYMIKNFFMDQPSGVDTTPEVRIVNQDLNGDRKIDLQRSINRSGLTLKEEYDIDFDEIFDFSVLYDRGRMIERHRDLDKNGIYDESYYYDKFGRPYFSELRMNLERRLSYRIFYKEDREFKDYVVPEDGSHDGRLPGGENWPWRKYTDTDGDAYFDLLEEFNSTGEVIHSEKISKDHAGNKPPLFPERL
jgi:hypothetical protein